jgi:hypothetical protein
LINGWARKVTSIWPEHSISYTLVITIEEIGIPWMEPWIILGLCHQKELLEKPGSMGQMPFGRAYIHNRLHHVIFSEKWPAKFKRMISHLFEFPEKQFTPIFRNSGCRLAL